MDGPLPRRHLGTSRDPGRGRAVRAIARSHKRATDERSPARHCSAGSTASPYLLHAPYRGWEMMIVVDGFASACLPRQRLLCKATRTSARLVLPHRLCRRVNRTCASEDSDWQGRLRSSKGDVSPTATMMKRRAGRTRVIGPTQDRCSKISSLTGIFFFSTKHERCAKGNRCEITQQYNGRSLRSPPQFQPFCVGNPFPKAEA